MRRLTDSLVLKVAIVWVITTSTFATLAFSEGVPELVPSIAFVWYLQIYSFLPFANGKMSEYALWAFNIVAAIGLLFALSRYLRLRSVGYRENTKKHFLDNFLVLGFSAMVVAKNVWSYLAIAGSFGLKWNSLLTGPRDESALYSFNSYDFIVALALIWQMLTPKMWNKQKNKVAPEHYETKSVSD
jgi:hypothetical protein